MFPYFLSFVIFSLPLCVISLSNTNLIFFTQSEGFSGDSKAENSDPVYPCTICNKTFASKSKLELHTGIVILNSYVVVILSNLPVVECRFRFTTVPLKSM